MTVAVLKISCVFMVAMAAAAALVVVAGALLWRPEGPAGGESEPGAGTGDVPIAFVSRSDGVVWDYHQPAAAGLGLIGNDPIELASGRIRVEFFDGSSATIVAPSNFTLLGDQEMGLGSCQVVVRSDGPTSGFTVRTPGAVFFDVGTEFALAVVDSVGTKMHVIEGEVIASLLSEDNVALDERSAFASDFLTVDPYDGISDADLGCTGGERSRWSSAPQGKISFAHRLRNGVTDREKTGESGKDRGRRGGVRLETAGTRAVSTGTDLVTGRAGIKRGARAVTARAGEARAPIARTRATVGDLPPVTAILRAGSTRGAATHLDAGTIWSQSGNLTRSRSTSTGSWRRLPGPRRVLI